MTFRLARMAGHRGFTLMEMMVALLLTGIVALVAHALFAQVILSADAIQRGAARSAADRDRLWFQSACRGVETGGTEGSGFVGDGRQATFTTRLPSAGGWPDPRRAVIAVRDDVVTLEAGEIRAQLPDSVDLAAIDYLSDLEGSGGWVAGWDSPVSAPTALRVRWVRSGVEGSFICPLGGRG